ncbi:hypothetical protein BDV18DRAFT_144607 [Aspergillus unguis]
MSYQYPPNQQYPPPHGPPQGPPHSYPPGPQYNGHFQPPSGPAPYGHPGSYQPPQGPPNPGYSPQPYPTGHGYPHSPHGAPGQGYPPQHGPPQHGPPQHGPPQHGPPQHAPPQQHGYPGYAPPHSPQPPYPQQFQASPGPPGPQGPYGAPPPAGYGAPPPVPSIPTTGYTPGQVATGDFRREAEVLRKAMKGFGTDEKALIGILGKPNALQIAAIRSTYSSHIGRDLYSDVKSETSSYFRQGLLAIIDGPLMHDTELVRDAVQGVGTKEWLLDDVLLGRTNADLLAIKNSYDRTYRRSLERDVEGDLSFKTKTLFMNVLRAQRHEENYPVDIRAMQAEAQTIHGATAARMVNNADEVCALFARSSNQELKALNHAFSERYHTSLESHIEKEFSGHMKDALLHMLRSALDPAMRDAVALEECMKGMGTKDERLVVRVVRVHWDRLHLENVKRAYHHRFKQDLVHRVKGETSGDYQRLLVAMLE